MQFDKYLNKLLNEARMPRDGIGYTSWIPNRQYKKEEIVWYKENESKYVDGREIPEIFAAVIIEYDTDIMEPLSELDTDDDDNPWDITRKILMSFIVKLNNVNGKLEAVGDDTSYVYNFNMVYEEDRNIILNELKIAERKDWIALTVNSGVIRFKNLTKDAKNYGRENEDTEENILKYDVVAYDFGSAEGVQKTMVNYAKKNKGLLGAVDSEKLSEYSFLSYSIPEYNHKYVKGIQADLSKPQKFKPVKRINLNDIISNVASPEIEENKKIMKNMASTIDNSTVKGAVVTFQDHKKFIMDVISFLPNFKIVTEKFADGYQGDKEELLADIKRGFLSDESDMDYGNVKIKKIS